MLPAILAGAAAVGSIASNLYNSSQDRKSRNRARNGLSEQQAQASSDYDKILSGIDDYYKQRGSLGTAQDAKDYKAAIAGYDPNDFIYDLSDPNNQFSYTKNVNDFITPLRDNIIANEIAGVQHSAAGAGLGRGSGAAEAIAQAVADKDLDLYKEAQADYRDDRDFAYKKYSDFTTAMQNNLDKLRQATDTKLTMQGNLANDYYSVMDAAQSDRLKAQQDRIATNATYANAMAGLY